MHMYKITMNVIDLNISLWFDIPPFRFLTTIFLTLTFTRREFGRWNMIYFSGSNQMGGNRKYCGRECGDCEAQLGEKMEGKEWIKFIFHIPPRVTRLPKTRGEVYFFFRLELYICSILHRAQGVGKVMTEKVQKLLIGANPRWIEIESWNLVWSFS